MYLNMSIIFRMCFGMFAFRNRQFQDIGASITAHKNNFNLLKYIYPEGRMYDPPTSHFNGKHPLNFIPFYKICLLYF